MPEFVLDVSKEEFETSGSKFITFDPNDKVGTRYYKEVELDVPDWDTVGVSIKFPVRIVGPEGDPDIGKEDKLSCGVSPRAIWKLKETLKAVNVPLTYRKGADGIEHPTFDSDAVAGKRAIGCWELQLGVKGGDPSRGEVKFPKLVALKPI
jgi:hypothetical protein